MSGVSLWYEIRVLVREMEPVVFGPINLVVADTGNPEMAILHLAKHISQQWVDAMRDGKLWELNQDAAGFILVNPALVLATLVRVVDAPAQKQADAPAASTGASGLEELPSAA